MATVFDFPFSVRIVEWRRGALKMLAEDVSDAEDKDGVNFDEQQQQHSGPGILCQKSQTFPHPRII